MKQFLPIEGHLTKEELDEVIKTRYFHNKDGVIDTVKENKPEISAPTINKIHWYKRILGRK